MKKLLTLFTALLFVGTMWGADYVKVTSASDLVAGEVYVIAEISANTKYLVTGYGEKLANTSSGFTVSNNTITTSTASPLEFTLGTVTSGNNTYYTLKYSSSNYLGYGSSANFETATTTTSTKEQWSITPSSSAYKILNVNTNTRYIGRNNANIGPYSTSNSYPNCYLFKKQASTFTVTYDANGATSGDVPTDNTKYQSGATVTVKGNTGNLAKTGYTFGGWNTKDDGTGTTYAADATFSISAATTLYAKWNANQYNVALASVDDVTLSASYGTSSTLTEGNNADIDCGTELTLSATGLASGYMFTWKVTDGEDSDVTEDVLDGTTLTVPAYAITISGTVQEIPLYTVTFNAGSGSCETASSKEAAQNAGVTLPTATISVTGWSFAGWAEASVTNTEVAPTLYAASSTYHPTENCTLYAVYKFLQGTEGEYVRATSLANVKAASKVILVNGGKTLTTDLSNKDALSESEGKVTAADKTVFDLSGNDNDGYTLTGASGKIGANSLPTSNGTYTDIALTNSNSTWSIVVNTNTDNTFTFINKGGTNVGLEYNSSASKWSAYKPSSSPAGSSYYATKVYLKNFSVAYNSNPAAIINPTIEFTTAGNKSLYVQDEPSYTNAANVTGIEKAPVYSSSDATVATVSAAGVVTALKAGSTTITAKVEKEVGVNTEASVSYTVTVKDAKTIAGLKAMTDGATKSFTADLTNAVVTYVNGDYAYIQDASGAVYASCGSDLTAGKKINGAVSGTIKALYKIDEITAIELSEATVTDGDIPAALTKTVAELTTSTTTLEGQLVQVSGATVSASLTNGSASGGKIKDGSKVDEKVAEINLYAPKSNIEALKDAEGTFTGYISYYNATSYRLNIYEQSQITLTKNAPTDQPLSFASDAIALDKPSEEYGAFHGQAVSGNKTTPTYSIEEGDDEDGVVSDIDDKTGAIVLSGNEGTATITVSVPTGETTEAGVTTPWKAGTLTYTITVTNIYTVDLVIKVDGVAEAHGNTATIANRIDSVHRYAGETAALVANCTTGYQFVNWTVSSEDITIDDATKANGAIATINGDGTITANFTAVPELLVSETALDLGYAKLNGSLDEKTFKISGASLEEGNLTLTLDEAIKDAFTISPNKIAVNGTLAETTITVTPVTTTAGNFSGNLTISGGGLNPVKTVALSSVIEQTYTVTWSVNGEETSQTDIENTTLTPPATGTLAGKVFVGWAEAAIDGQTDVEPTFINITKMPAEDKELYAVYASGNPAVDETETISLTTNQSANGWEATGTTTYFGKPYGMKTVNAKIVNKSMDAFSSYANTAESISVGVKCLQNGGTGSRLTISLVDGEGNAIAGTGKEVTPINTNLEQNATYQNVSYTASEVNDKNATGYMIQCTTYGSPILLTETKYAITIASTLHAYITNAYAVTFEAPKNGTLTVKNGENAVTSGDMFPKGTLLTVEAEPASGFQLASLTANGDDIAADKEFTITNEDVVVVATFSQATALDNTELDSKAVKVMRNGILYIEKNGKTYNAQGQLVK